jgi:hypothetical protein
MTPHLISVQTASQPKQGYICNYSRERTGHGAWPGYSTSVPVDRFEGDRRLFLLESHLRCTYSFGIRAASDLVIQIGPACGLYVTVACDLDAC